MTSLLAEPEILTVGISPTLLGDLAAVGQYLLTEGYRFTTVTPATHARVLTRTGAGIATSLREIFGWNQPFAASALPASLLARMRSGGLVIACDDLLRSTVRFATVDGHIYAHDSYPTIVPDAVFFGPDSYRFIAAVHAHLRPCDLLVDVCCGSGVGGLEAGKRIAERVVLADINPRALAFAAANRLLAHNRMVILHHADLLDGIDERPEAIIANPPYLADPLCRTYRDGSGVLGTGLALRIVRESIQLLAPGGQLLIYTGTPIVDGIDRFAAAAWPLAWAVGAEVTYEEVDPDVFGEELETAPYAAVERIAAVVMTLTMPAR